MNYLTKIAEMTAALQHLQANITDEAKNQLIGIRKDNLHIELVWEDDFLDGVYFEDALGYGVSFEEEFSEIIYNFGEFIKSENFYEHQIFL